jgi:fatty acid desaturase
MSLALLEPTVTRMPRHFDREADAIEGFRKENAELFQKSDLRLMLHVGVALALLGAGTYAIIATPYLWLKILLGPLNGFVWFALGNVTVHHHHTHHNAAKSAICGHFLNLLHFVVVPDMGRHLKRYRRAHMNHHAHPLQDTDVDHRYSMEHYRRMSKNIWTKLLYYLELTFVGGHVPGRKDEGYLNRVAPADWSLEDYYKVKEREVRKAKRNSLIVWSIFLVCALFVPPLAWAFVYPLILVRNWSGFLGQFQHFDDELLDPSRTKNNRTKTYHVPSWLNYLAAGEISGHFIHHVYPELPYYNVERARKRLMRKPELARLVVNF